MLYGSISAVKIKVYDEKYFDQIREILTAGGIEPWTAGYRRTWSHSRVLGMAARVLLMLILTDVFHECWLVAVMGMLAYELTLAHYIYKLYDEDT